MRDYSVLIIGAGKISAFFDAPDDKAILTHAHAYTAHPGFRLTGFVDVDRNKALQAAAIWGGIAFESLEDAFGQETIDVVVVATPDDVHYELLKSVATFSPLVVLAEKPLTKTVEQAEEILQLYFERGISLAVNYSRRYVPEFIQLREKIATGVFGAYTAGTGYYGKGILHNGSHMIDLLRFLLGDIIDAKPLSAVNDFYPDDPSCSALLIFERGQFLMQAVDCRCFTIFELDLLFEQTRVRIIDAGFRLEYSSVLDCERFAGYRTLGQRCETDTHLENALYAAADNIYNHLTLGAPLLCLGEDGLRAIESCLHLGTAPI
ncbi:MAG: Gfo/Idh/MocA family oxidoreductase [Desulfuromonadales bacterium]